MTPKLRRALEWTGFGVGAALMALLGLCAAVVLAVGEPSCDLLGNRAETLSRSSRGGPTFRFAVLGDTQKGTTGLRRMLARLRDETPDFYIHTGDLVSENDVGHYLLAKWTVVRAGLAAPLLVVPGNHDIKRNTYLFGKHLGHLEFAIERAGIRLISVNDALGAPPPAHELEQRLRDAGNATLILFMHVPPWDVRAETFTPMPGFDEMIALVRKYRVRYVFAGHRHLYQRIEHDGTVWIVNGAGSDYDSWKLGTKVYATVVDVDGRTISDRLVELEPSHSVWDNVEHLALGHVAETYRRAPIRTWAATAAILGAWVWLIVRLWRKKPAAA